LRKWICRQCRLKQLEVSIDRSPVVGRRKSPATNRAPCGRQPAPAEALLIESLKAGDAEVLETIFNTYSEKLYNMALRILGEAADTQEVIQDVFWTVFRKAESFRGDSRFSTWLYRLTFNAALGKIRRGKKHKEVRYEEWLSRFRKDGHHRVRPVVDWSDTLDEKYARCEMQKLLANALEQLNPIDKSVTVLSDLEGLSDQEIATSVGLTVSAVKSRLHRRSSFSPRQRVPSAIQRNLFPQKRAAPAVTGMMGFSPEQAMAIKDQEREQIPLKCRGHPNDVARWIMSFADPVSEWMTGQVIAVDGGSHNRIACDRRRYGV